MASLCHKTRYADQDVALDIKHIIRKINSAQKALYQDFHEYWLERCAETIAWEKDNGITSKAKRQKNHPRVPSEYKPPSPEIEETIKIPKEKSAIHARMLKRKAQLERSTSAAISFILRKPMKNNHNKFIYDISKGTVTKKIKTGKRAIPTADSKEERRRTIDIKTALPELPLLDYITFDENDVEITPPLERPMPEPPDSQNLSQSGSFWL